MIVLLGNFIKHNEIRCFMRIPFYECSTLNVALYFKTERVPVNTKNQVTYFTSLYFLLRNLQLIIITTLVCHTAIDNKRFRLSSIHSDKIIYFCRMTYISKQREYKLIQKITSPTLQVSTFYLEICNS